MTCLCAGLALAVHHPLWPTAAVVLFALWIAAVTWRGYLWLLMVPAGVAFMSFSPWTGWIVFDEFDILLLGTLTGAYAQQAWAGRAPSQAPLPTGVQVALLLLGGMALWSLWRALADAGGLSLDWFAGYTDALNSVRVLKSEGYAVLFVPMLHRELARGSARAHQRMATGMVMGLSVVVLAALWERLAFAGLFDFSKPYRTVALFWEMHVGGEAIDAYLALVTPYAAWAVLSARRPLAWVGSAALVVLTAYTVLTTFSRGLYFSLAASLLLLTALLLVQRKNRPQVALLRNRRQVDWRAKATVMLWLVLAVEVLMVLGVGTFMLERLARSPVDLGSRAMHWQNGIALLQSGADWWLGKGPGRLPTHYARLGPEGEFSGQVQLRHEQNGEHDINRFVTVSGPKTQKRLAGQFALTQRVRKQPEGLHLVRLDVRAGTATDLQLEWCARHLLYDADCHTATLHVEADPAWQSVELPLVGVDAKKDSWHAPGLVMFALSVMDAGRQVDVDNLHLIGPPMEDLLANGDFSDGMARWLGSAQSYFLPWHIDNLFLELLIERGLVGLLVFCVLAGMALWHLTLACARHGELHPYVLSALTGALCVGFTGSLLDVPRVMFLFYLMALEGALLVSSSGARFTHMRKINDEKDRPFRLDLQ
ncbi:MAG: hypothetical protein K9K35_00205 [Rhodoferax sp.]|nr:hypothetical protein [Rhodoferax sp.]